MKIRYNKPQQQTTLATLETEPVDIPFADVLVDPGAILPVDAFDEVDAVVAEASTSWPDDAVTDDTEPVVLAVAVSAAAEVDGFASADVPVDTLAVDPTVVDAIEDEATMDAVAVAVEDSETAAEVEAAEIEDATVVEVFADVDEDGDIIPVVPVEPTDPEMTTGVIGAES